MSRRAARRSQRFARAALVASALAAVVVGAAQSAGAQSPPPKDAQSAITLGRDAKARFDRGELAEALALFEAAERKAHSPVLVLYIARCQAGLGRLLEARDSFRRAASEPVDARSPEPFRNAVSDAGRELAELERELPKLSIRQSSLPADATVLVDGKELDAAARRGLVEVDPGTRIVVALSGDRELARTEVNAERGKVTTVELALEPPSSAQGGSAGTRPPPRAANDGVDAPRSSGSLWPGLVLTSIGAVGIGVGVGTRVAAFGLVDDVRERCDGNSCLASDAATIDDANTLQTVSTISLIVGGAAAATGVVLLIVRPGGADDSSVALDLRPGFLGLRGSF